LNYVLGANNIFLSADSEANIAHGIKEVINRILVKMPNTKVLLLGILPLGDPFQKKVGAINAIISKFNDDKHVFYLDMSNRFLDSSGNQNASLFSDGIHPTASGYLLWYQTMEPLLQKLLK
jgi:lysophospholipase L1-like esterase